MRRTSFLVPFLALALAVGACSQQKDPSAKELKEDIAKELRKGDASLTKDQAACYADLVVEELGVKDVVDVKYNADEPDGEMAKGIAAAAAAARTECGLVPTEATTPGATDSSTTSTTAAATSSTAG